MNNLSIFEIFDAVQCLEREAIFRRNVGGIANLARADDLDHVRRRAEAQYRALSEALPRLRLLKAEAADHREAAPKAREQGL